MVCLMTKTTFPHTIILHTGSGIKVHIKDGVAVEVAAAVEAVVGAEVGAKVGAKVVAVVVAGAETEVIGEREVGAKAVAEARTENDSSSECNRCVNKYYYTLQCSCDVLKPARVGYQRVLMQTRHLP